MRIRRWSMVARADIQAALMGCALVLASCGAVFGMCHLLPPSWAIPATVGIALLFCALAVVGGRVLFYNIANPTRKALYNTDRLTGLKSRNAFELDLQNIHAGPNWQSAGLLLVDLDRLKAVNDAMGHIVGDEYLCLAANVLRQECGGRLCPYRVGGDEFAVLAPELDEAGLQTLGTRIAAQFDRQRPAGWPVPVSLSVGWAEFDSTTDRNLYDTYRRADGRMYAHKRSRRGDKPS